MPKRGEAAPPAGTAVPEDSLREMLGRSDVFMGVGGPALPGRGESRLIERADVVRAWPVPGSAPGTGDGAEEPFAAAVAFLTCARSWEWWRSVRYATCWRRNGTVTSKREALCWGVNHGIGWLSAEDLQIDPYGSQLATSYLPYECFTYNLSPSWRPRKGCSRAHRPSRHPRRSGFISLEQGGLKEESYRRRVDKVTPWNGQPYIHGEVRLCHHESGRAVIVASAGWVDDEVDDGDATAVGDPRPTTKVRMRELLSDNTGGGADCVT